MPRLALWPLLLTATCLLTSATAWSDDAAPLTQPPPGIDLVEPAQPLTDDEQALLDDFDAKRLIWAQTLIEMKTIQIRYNNSVDRSPSSMQRYVELRDRARGELRSLYDAAIAFFTARPDDFITASFAATTLDFRRQRSYYDDCYAGAKLLIDAGVQFPHLRQLAARAALVDGEFDEVMPNYEKFLEDRTPDDLEPVDHRVAALAESDYRQRWEAELIQRQSDAQRDDLPRVLLETTAGPVVLELFEDQAPNTVANFIQLVESGYYDETEFYQVIDDLLAQGGDPGGDGSGMTGQFIPDEHDRPDARGVFRGSLLMAKQSAGTEGSEFVPNSGSAQFVIALMPFGTARVQQTVFGRVIEGMDVVGSFQRIDPTEEKENQLVLPPDRVLTAKVLRKRDHDYSVTYTR